MKPGQRLGGPHGDTGDVREDLVRPDRVELLDHFEPQAGGELGVWGMRRSPTTTLTDQDKLTLRTAAWGAISLMAAAGAAGSPHKAATHGSIALTSATSLAGHVLTKAPKGVKYGKSVAEAGQTGQESRSVAPEPHLA
ncbi:hypothetical protein [Nonomuraea recticatena]|uniref:hypothetical protein n=1 Tax=Nonomuraea recticatena TaxID=46178 RepID=UPI00360EED66